MGAGAVPVDSVVERVPALLERLRGVHRKMVDAALIGDGFERMAELASDEIGKPVAIVIPERQVAVVWPDQPHAVPLEEIETLISLKAQGEAGTIPESVELLVPITFDHEFQGGVAMLASVVATPDDAGEFLHLAAMASATALALEQARELESARSDGGPIEELLAGRIDGAELVARIDRDISSGFFVAAVAARSSRPHQALALVEEVYPDSTAELVDDRIYAIVANAAEGSRPPGADALDRIRAHGSLATSTSYTDPAEAGLALHEADLILDALADDPDFAEELVQGTAGVYGLLFRVLAARPDEVESFYRDTIEPATRYDDQYGADLIATLEAYLANDCNMNATAKAIHAHRHTIAYRLERVRELTGLDPAVSEDRERLGLGLKARRLIAREV